ncbi:fasciclin domain-containing protein [Psychrobacter sp. H7-1]|nr:fasciclin domain-containing protein [Psychrobacter sp. H7-1]
MTKSQLLANPALLKQVLTYHVVPATVYSSQVKAGMVKTVQGTSFSISNDGKISDAKGRVANLIKTDIKASNGVIHVIDKVLLP